MRLRVQGSEGKTGLDPQRCTGGKGFGILAGNELDGQAVQAGGEERKCPSPHTLLKLALNNFAGSACARKI